MSGRIFVQIDSTESGNIRDASMFLSKMPPPPLPPPMSPIRNRILDQLQANDSEAAMLAFEYYTFKDGYAANLVRNTYVNKLSAELPSSGSTSILNVCHSYSVAIALICFQSLIKC